MFTARMTSKGQITVPKQVRDRLGVGQGEEVGFYEKNGIFFIKKNVPASPFDKWVGHLRGGKRKKTDTVVEEMRGK